MPDVVTTAAVGLMAISTGTRVVARVDPAAPRKEPLSPPPAAVLPSGQ